MRIREAIGIGLLEVRASLRFVAVAYGANVLVALPLAAALRKYLQDDLGHEIAAENLRKGWDDLWHRGFQSEAKGLAATFDASVVGVGAVLQSLDDLLQASLFDLPPALVAAGLAYLAVWVLLSGGFIGRFVARGGDRPPFFREAGHHFLRFATITALAGAAFVAVLGGLLPSLSSLVERLTYETVDERIVFAWTVGKYLVVWSFVWTISLVADYAKIASVLDPSATVARAIRDAATAVVRHPARVYGVSLGIGFIGLLVVGAYAVLAPGAGQTNGFQILMAFAISQLYVFARVALRALGHAAHTTMAPTVLPGQRGT